jgi:hypothetical protein
MTNHGEFASAALVIATGGFVSQNGRNRFRLGWPPAVHGPGDSTGLRDLAGIGFRLP